MNDNKAVLTSVIVMVMFISGGFWFLSTHTQRRTACDEFVYHRQQQIEMLGWTTLKNEEKGIVLKSIQQTDSLIYKICPCEINNQTTK